MLQAERVTMSGLGKGDRGNASWYCLGSPQVGVTLENCHLWGAGGALGNSIWFYVMEMTI